MMRSVVNQAEERKRGERDGGKQYESGFQPERATHLRNFYRQQFSKMCGITRNVEMLRRVLIFDRRDKAQPVCVISRSRRHRN